MDAPYSWYCHTETMWNFIRVSDFVPHSSSRAVFPSLGKHCHVSIVTLHYGHGLTWTLWTMDSCPLWSTLACNCPPIRFTQQNSCCVSQSTMKHMQALYMCVCIENQTSLYLVMVIGSACLWISWLNTKVHLIVFIIDCRGVISIWRQSPISLEHVYLWCSLFDPR